jgi:hypothetical protein
MKTLPERDEYGNYWYNPDHKKGPAIFPEKIVKRDEVKATGRFFVLVSVTKGFLFDGVKLAKFDSFDEAVKALEAAK